MEKFKKAGKVIILDTLGILLIILSPLLGWLPGPGGIPLFLAGLGLLSINHAWAKRFQARIMNEGMKFFKKMFSQHPSTRAAYDLVSAGLIILGIYLINTYTRNFTLTFAIFSLGIGIALFLGNRERLESLTKYMKKRFTKKN